ncbi:MAG: hypothetical protein R2799_13975 [Crocinitomicaceae bacterium]
MKKSVLITLLSGVVLLSSCGGGDEESKDPLQNGNGVEIDCKGRREFQKLEN